MRASWDEYFMQIVEVVKTRSTCLRRQVGAVIVKDNRIITTGYNGAPSGLKHCTELGGCERQKMGIPCCWVTCPPILPQNLFPVHFKYKLQNWVTQQKVQHCM